MSTTLPTIPAGEGTPKRFVPEMAPKDVVQLLRQMLAELVKKDTEEAAEHKPINHRRKEFEKALTEALYLANSARFTGMVPQHWQPNLGTQLPLLTAPETPQKLAS